MTRAVPTGPEVRASEVLIPARKSGAGGERFCGAFLSEFWALFTEVSRSATASRFAGNIPPTRAPITSPPAAEARANGPGANAA